MSWRLLGIFIIGMFVLMLLSAFSGMVSSMLGAFGEFLTNSTWGILALLFFGLSAAFFYASSKTYIDVREKGRVIDTLRPILQKMDTFFKHTKSSTMEKSDSSITKRNSEESVIDLSRVDLQTMVRELAVVINKPNPVFFKGWGNQRLKLDVARVCLIKEYIEAIRSAGESFIQLNADAILSYEKVEKLVQINRNALLKQLKESELQIDLVEQQYKSQIDTLHINVMQLESVVLEKISMIENLNAQTKQILGNVDNERNRVQADIERMKNESESNIKIREEESQARIELDKDKAKAEIFVMKLKATDESKISKQKARVLDKIIDEMNLDNIKPMHVYMLIELFETRNESNYFDFDGRVKIMDETLEKMKIENKKGNAEAREADAKADEIVAQAKQNIKDLYNTNKR